jgi:hypothetical protein
MMKREYYPPRVQDYGLSELSSSSAIPAITLIASKPLPRRSTA